MEPKMELAKPRDFGEIIGDTFTFIRQNFKDLLKNFFIFCGFFIVGATIAIAVVQYKTMALANGLARGGTNYTETPSYDNFYTIWVNGLLMGLFVVLGACANLLYAICYVALYKQKGNIAPTTEEMWGYFKYYFFRVFFSLILIFIMLGVGYMICLIPGIYLFPIFGLIFPIMIVENSGFGDAFSRAFRLISSNWWVTAGSVFVLWLIAYIMLFVISIPTSILNVSTMFLRPATVPNIGLAQTIFTALLQQLIQVILIIPTIGICLCYFNLTETKDGTSLLDRIEKFGGQHSPNNLPTEEY